MIVQVRIFWRSSLGTDGSLQVSQRPAKAKGSPSDLVKKNGVLRGRSATVSFFHS